MNSEEITKEHDTVREDGRKLREDIAKWGRKLAKRARKKLAEESGEHETKDAIPTNGEDAKVRSSEPR